MSVKFTQEYFRDRKEFNTGIHIEPVANVNKFECKSSLKGKDFLLPWKIVREKKNLLQEVNNLIGEFNDINKDLTFSMGGGFVVNSDVNRYYYPKIVDDLFERKGLHNHIQYLTQYTHNIFYNLNKTWDRLAYNRTKEFEKFLKNLEGKKVDTILKEINKFRSDTFDRWKKEVQRATLYNVDFVVNQIINKDLKVKQESRRKQLLEKLEVWKGKLSNPKNEKKKEFAGIVDHLINILNGQHRKPLTSKEIGILKECFGKDRSWAVAYHGALLKKYIPFPKLNLNNNRVIIALYGLVTDRDGKSIDPLIDKYLA